MVEAENVLAGGCTSPDPALSPLFVSPPKVKRSNKLEPSSLSSLDEVYYRVDNGRDRPEEQKNKQGSALCSPAECLLRNADPGFLPRIWYQPRDVSSMAEGSEGFGEQSRAIRRAFVKRVLRKRTTSTT